VYDDAPAPITGFEIRHHRDFGWLLSVAQLETPSVREDYNVVMCSEDFVPVDTLKLFDRSDYHDYYIEPRRNGSYFIADFKRINYDTAFIAYQARGRLYDPITDSVTTQWTWSVNPSNVDLYAESYYIGNGCLNYSAYPRDGVHANSIDIFYWSIDSMLVAISERHTFKIRFFRAWRDSSGIWQTQHAFRLGSHFDPNSDFTPATPEDTVSISAGHHWRFLFKEGDELFGSYFDNATCLHPDGRMLIFALDLKTMKMRIVDETGWPGHSWAEGSAHLLPPVPQSTEALQAALQVINKGKGPGVPRHPAHLPFSDTTFQNVLQGFYPVKDAPQIALATMDDSLLAGISFTYTAVDDWDKDSLYEMAQGRTYRTPVLDSVVFPEPLVPCRDTVINDRPMVALTVNELPDPVWMNGSTDPQLMLELPDVGDSILAMAKGKTQPAMLGHFYSRPRWITADGCTAPDTMQHANPVADQRQKVLLYPNPVADQLNLIIFTPQTQTGQLHLFNHLGERLSLKRLSLRPGRNAVAMKMPPLPAGVYHATVRLNEGLFHKTLFVSK